MLYEFETFINSDKNGKKTLQTIRRTNELTTSLAVSELYIVFFACYARKRICMHFEPIRLKCYRIGNGWCFHVNVDQLMPQEMLSASKFFEA